MSVKIDYKNSLSKKNLSNLVLFTNENYNINKLDIDRMFRLINNLICITFENKNEDENENDNCV